jgi:hypothetical protein
MIPFLMLFSSRAATGREIAIVTPVNAASGVWQRQANLEQALFVDILFPIDNFRKLPA